MIDTIHCHLTTTSTLIDTLPSLLTSVSGEGVYNGIPFISGHLGNIKIRATYDHLSLKGSWCKYHLGDNLKVMTRKDIEMCLESLSDNLHLDIEQAHLTRLDKGVNLLMNHSCNSYLDNLIQSPRLQRVRQEHSLYFQNKSRSQLFYNKVQQMKAKDVPIWVGDRQVLRFETSAKKVKPIYRRNIVARELYDEYFYMNMIDDTLDQYNSIKKQPSMQLSSDWINKPNDIILYLAMEAIEARGLINTYGLINEVKDNNQWSKKEYNSRAKNKIKELIESRLMIGESDLMQELDLKMNAAINNYR